MPSQSRSLWPNRQQVLQDINAICDELEGSSIDLKVREAEKVLETLKAGNLRALLLNDIQCDSSFQSCLSGERPLINCSRSTETSSKSQSRCVDMLIPMRGGASFSFL